MKKIADNDKLDHDGAPFEPPDPADIANTDTFEELVQNQTFFAMTTPDQPAIDESLDMLDAEQLPNDMEAGNTETMPDAEQLPNDMEAGNTETMPDVPEQLPNDIEACNIEAMLTVVIDRFPSASAGAPIPGMPCSNPVYEPQQGTDGDSIWSPFMSQCNWLFARWAKMRGPISSAVMELLAIPEVQTSPHLIFTLLTQGQRL